MDDQKLFAARQLIAALGTDNAISLATHTLREEALLQLPELLPNLDANQIPYDYIATAWMMCSYGQTPLKHHIKPALNAFIRREIDEAGIDRRTIAEPRRSATKPDAPHVLVIAPFFKSTHALYRWFGPSVARLRERFQTTGLILSDLDDKGSEAFDRATVVNISGAPFMTLVFQLVDLVRRIGPDIVYYVDAAMHPLTVFLANCRLAPLQIIGGGHPASTYSDAIDYFAIEKSFAHGMGDFTEKPALFPTARMTLPAFPVRDVNLSPREPGRLRIVVPATLPKLVRPFVIALANIQRELKGRAELHITTNTDGEAFQIAALEIDKIFSERSIPGPKLYPHLSFEHYAYLLEQSDMFLSPFPFSGSTTINDCLFSGVPGCAMDGPEILQTQGAEQMRRFDVATALTVAPDLDAYIANAVAFATDHRRRSHFAAALAAKNPREHFIYNGPSLGLAATIERLFLEHLTPSEKTAV